MTRGGSFPLFPEVRLESLFFYLPSMMVFAVIFPVVMINSYCQSIHILKQGGFFLFSGRDGILNLIGETLVIAVAKNTILST